jgi:hypothetical protein
VRHCADRPPANRGHRRGALTLISAIGRSLPGLSAFNGAPRTPVRRHPGGWWCCRRLCCPTSDRIDLVKEEDGTMRSAAFGSSPTSCSPAPGSAPIAAARISRSSPSFSASLRSPPSDLIQDTGTAAPGPCSQCFRGSRTARRDSVRRAWRAAGAGLLQPFKLGLWVATKSRRRGRESGRARGDTGTRRIGEVEAAVARRVDPRSAGRIASLWRGISFGRRRVPSA